MRLHFLGQHKQKTCKGTTSRPFSHDVIAATLVDHNDEMSVMLVHQNNPLGIELYLYAYTSLCFMESIRPLVMRLKTFEAKQSHSQSFSGSQIISHIGKVFEGSLLAVHLPCTSGETILQDNLIRPLEVSLSQMLHLFFPPDP